MAPGTSYPLTVTNGDPQWTADLFAAWIDLNNDKVFDASEQVATGSGVGPYSGSISVAAAGTYRMRLRIVDGSVNPMSPCGTVSYGSVQDYTLSVAVQTAPTVSGNTVSGAAGSTVAVTATVTPVAGHPIASVSANMASVGGGALALFDDGTHGDGGAGDGLYGNLYTIPGATAPASYNVPISATDNQPQTGTGTAHINVVYPGDECSTAIAVAPGTIPFDSTGPDTSTSVPNTTCSTMTFDKWFAYTPAVNGSMTVATCAGTTADTMLALYSDCSTSIACLDDGCGAGLESTITTCVTGGQTYFVRVGGWNGARWAGTWNLSFNPGTAPIFTANNTCVAQGVPAVITATVSGLGCPAQTVVSAVANDTLLGGAGNVALNDANASPDAVPADLTFSGFSANVSVPPGVYNVPITFNFSGAGAVTHNASVTVAAYADPAGATPEGDACGNYASDPVNGGCNFTPVVYGAANLCTDYTGDAANSTTNRDLDWWQFSVPAADTVTISGQTKFHDPLLLVVSPDCAFTTYGAAGIGCVDFSFTATLPAAGNYIFIIAPANYLDAASACGTSANYHFRISPSAGCAPPPETGRCMVFGVGGGVCTGGVTQADCQTQGGVWGGPNSLCDVCCRNDFNGDTDVGTDLDIENFFSCLGGNCCATCPPNADFNCDGDVGTDADIEAFFRVLGGGPC